MSEEQSHAVERWIAEGRDAGFIPDPQRLTELATGIVEDHRIVRASVRRTFEHAIACGEKLMEARRLVPKGTWTVWLEQNVALDRPTANLYTRFATFRRELEAAGVTTVDEAIRHVRQNGLVVEYARPPLSEDVIRSIFELAANGLTHHAIARQTGAGRTSVTRILHEQKRPVRRKQPVRVSQLPPIPIRDDMIEGMARWLAANFASRFPGGVTDQVRHAALEALGVALGRQELEDLEAAG